MSVRHHRHNYNATVRMIGPLSAAGQDLEAAGAAILQRRPPPAVGGSLIDASVQLERFSQLLAELGSPTSPPSLAGSVPSGAEADRPSLGGGDDAVIMLAAQRMKHGAERMKAAGTELRRGSGDDDTSGPKSSGKMGWLKE
jgi:hypothetical protein